MVIRPGLDKRPIKVVAVKGCKNSRSCLSNVLEESFKQSFFVGLVENGESTHVVVFTRRVLEVSYVLADNLPICDQEA